MTRDECATWEMGLHTLVQGFKNLRSGEAKFYWEWMWELFRERCEMDES